MGVKVKTIADYKDRETQKIYRVGSTRTVSEERAAELHQKGKVEYVHARKKDSGGDGVT